MRKSTRLKKGYTLIEMLTVIGVIAVLAAIAVTGIIAIRNALEFRRLNDTAKAVYMAAQSNLVEMRASGEITALKEDASSNVPVSGAYHVSGDRAMNAGFEGWLAEYFYTSSRFPGAMESGSAYSLILPANSIDATVRDKNILIEYNPYSASVYSVFYTEREDLTMVGADGTYAVERGEAWRKSNKVGYYNGSSQESASGDIYTDEEVFASVELVNEVYENGRKVREDAAIVVSVPIPSAYLMNSGVFMRNIHVSAVVTGEQSGGTFILPESAFADKDKRYSDDGKSIELRAWIDSLRDNGSFAGLAENNAAENRARGISEIASEEEMRIKPGENVIVEAIFSYDTSEGDFFAAPASVWSEPANPLFSRMEVTTDGRYIIHLSNGRNLQNLNQVAPSIGEKVYQVVVDNDIYWNETVSFYEHDSNSEEEVPGRCLPYFVPITNERMFGSAVFHADTSAFLTMTNVPAMDDYKDTKPHAVVEGNGHRICYIDVNSQDYRMQYVGSSGAQESALGKPYYAGVTPTSTKTDRSRKNVGQPDAFSGLFSYANTTIQNLNVVNPTIRGAMLQRWDVSESGLGFPAAGSLVGAMGWNSYLTNCGAYIDPTDRYFNRANLKNYGVVGYGAVGGLVGYSKSHRTLEDGELDVRAEHLAFNRCFASVNVEGTMYHADDPNRYILGYVEGVGGLVGISVLSNYYDCYSGSTVTGRNFYFQTLVGGARARGIGGFIGTCRGTRMTNCFATGDVVAYKMLSGGDAAQTNNLGAAPFVGVIYNGESYSYTDSAFRDFIKDLFGRTTYQFSRFVNCYALGSVKQMNNRGEKTKYLSGFAGLYLKGADGIRGALPPDGNSREDNTAGAYLDGRRTRDYPNTYLYRDVYFLNSWGEVKDWTDVDSTLNNIIGGIGDIFNQDWAIGSGKRYFREIGTGITYQEFTNLVGKVDQDTFSNWKNLSAAQTHSYDYTGAYPFSVPSTQDSFYGTWPAPKLNAHIGYYEIYDDNTMGVYAFGEEYSTLKKDGKIKSDGYCILTSSRNGRITVRVGSKDFTLEPESKGISIRNNNYAVYRLSQEIEKAVLETKNDTGTAAQKFCSHIEVVVSGETPYHLYYNPIFAKAIFISTRENTQAMTAADWSTVELPSSISIRTARQLYELGCSQTEKGIGAKYWGEGYNFVQELDIDAASYSWKDVYYSGKTNDTDRNGPVFNPIGANDTPFCGTYNGGLGYVEKAKIQNAAIKARADGNYGIFGVVGKTGTLNSMEAAEAAEAVAAEESSARAAEPANSRIENLTLVGKTLRLNGTLNNAALLCGVNNGVLKNISVTGTATVEGSDIANTGLIAGSNAGILTGISIHADAAALDGTNVGAVAGANSGSISAEVDLATFTGKTFADNGAVGGVVGNQTAGTLTGNFIIENVVGQVNDTSFSCAVGGIFGKFSGTLRAGSTELQTVKSQYGTAAGLAGEVKDGQISQYTLSVKDVFGGKGAAGGFANVEKLAAENVLVQISNSVKAASGDAAGFAMEIAGGSTLLDQCAVELGGIIRAEQGNAAGFVVSSEGTLVDSNVFLGAPDSNAVKIQAPNGTASGFAGRLGGRADTSGVSGVGSIEGGVDAAGFAAVISGEANACYATPASLRTTSKRTAYLKANADQLKVTASGRAAGFAVEIGGSTIGSYALGTVRGTTAAGYVVENSGSIRRAMANVTLASAGSGFADTNKGAIDAAYVWYDGSVENGFVSSNTGNINGCYAAALNEDAENLFTAEGSGFKDCYAVTKEESAASEIEGVTNVTVDYMNEVDVADLDRNTVGTNWQRTGIKQYPYSSSLSFKAYMLPSLFNMSHYGDWVDTYEGGSVSYGLLYYEVDSRENYYVGTVKVFDKGLWPDNAQERAVRDLQTLDQMKENCVSYGYALFTDDPNSFKDDADFVDFDHPLTKISNTFFATYGVNCYPMTMEQRARNVTKPAPETLFGATFNPYFADAMWETNGGTAPNPYRVRCAQQLENICGFSDARFKLEVDVDYTGLQKLSEFSGILEGCDHVISGLSVPLVGTMKGGSISGLTVSGDLSYPFVETLTAGKIDSVTVNGNLARGFAGDVDGVLSKIIINGNVDGSNDKPLLGDVTGTVAGLKVTGVLGHRLAKSVGTNAKLTELWVDTFSGDRSMFGTVSGKIGSVYEEGVSEYKSGLIVGTASQSIADTVGKDAVIANVGVTAYSNTKGMFGTVSGKFTNVAVDSAVLTVTVKSGMDTGVIADKMTGAEVEKISLESVSMDVTVETKNLPKSTSYLNVGAVVGQADESMLNEVTVEKLSITVTDNEGNSGDQNNKTVVRAIAGLAGKTTGNSIIRNAKVSFTPNVENFKITQERDYRPNGTAYFGGMVGDNQAVVVNALVENLNLQKDGYPSSSSRRPVVEMHIGGLIGIMEPNAALYGSKAGQAGADLSIKVQGIELGSKKTDYYVGGAVGSDASNVDKESRARYGRMDEATQSAYAAIDETYNNVSTYAVTQIVSSNNKDESVYMGQFIGKVTNGIFDACEGWGNSDKFFGAIESSKTSITATPDRLVSANPDVPTSGFTAPNADVYKQSGKYDINAFNASLSRCTFKSGTEVKNVSIEDQYYVYDRTVGDYSRNVYTVNKLKSRFVKEEKTLADWYDKIPGHESDYYFKPNENVEEYCVIVSFTRSGSFVNRKYHVTYRDSNGQTATWDQTPSTLFTTYPFYTIKASDVNNSGRFILAAFNGGTGYAMTKNGTAVTAEVMTGISENHTQFSFTEYENGTSIVWAPTGGRNSKAFGELKISNSGLSVSSGQSNEVTAASNKEQYTISANGGYVSFDGTTFTGGSSAMAFYLYQITGTETQKWYNYARSNPAVGSNLKEETVTLAGFTYGSSTGLEAVETTLPDAPEIVAPDMTRVFDLANAQVAQLPDAEVPEETVPETTEPEETVPETTEPEETVPETTEPEETAPETSEPEETVPETTASSESEPTEPVSPSETNSVSEAAEPPKSSVQETLPEIDA